MSWDLYLVPEAARRDPGRWLENATLRPVDEAVARWHAELLRARRPELELYGPDEYGFELSEPEGSPFPLQLGLHGDHASLSVAYWDLGERDGELREIVAGLVSALREETGWVAYDPQDDRFVELDELRGALAAGRAEGVEHVARIAGDEPKPKRKRFFGLF